MTMEEDRSVTVRFIRVAKYSKEVEVPEEVAVEGEDAVWEWLADHE